MVKKLGRGISTNFYKPFNSKFFVNYETVYLFSIYDIINFILIYFHTPFAKFAFAPARIKKHALN